MKRFAYEFVFLFILKSVSSETMESDRFALKTFNDEGYLNSFKLIISLRKKFKTAKCREHEVPNIALHKFINISISPIECLHIRNYE